MKLLGNKVILQVVPTTTTSGIIIPDDASITKGWKKAVVLMLGVGVKPECAVKVGDRVLYQHGFDDLDKLELARHVPLGTKHDLVIGSPDNLFAIVEESPVSTKKIIKKNNK